MNATARRDRAGRFRLPIVLNGLTGLGTLALALIVSAPLWVRLLIAGVGAWRLAVVFLLWAGRDKD